MAASSSPSVKKGPQVFINIRGAELRNSFASHLHKALRSQGINAYIDNDLKPGEDLKILFDKIEESSVALAILSSRYTESHWCLDELVKIKDCMDRSSLWVIPIFYKLKTSIVHDLDGKFGLELWNLWRKPEYRDDRILKWDAALKAVVGMKALRFEEDSNGPAFANEITIHVRNYLTKDLLLREKNSKPQGRHEENPKPEDNQALNGIKPGERSLKQMEEKLDVECNDNETRIVGVVGMAGIGKTYLAKELSKKLKLKISRYVFIEGRGLDKLQLRNKLVKGLLKNQDINCGNENALEVCKDRLLEKKVAVVLDDVIDKEQLNALLENCDWIKKGSRIVITTRDKSLVKGLTFHLYEVPKLNDKDSLELFRAQICTTLEGNLLELSRKFVVYAGGNPLALKEFGAELYGKDKDHWETRLGTLTRRLGEKLRICYDELNEQQKDAFLDIACFFRSQDECYVRSLLDSFDPESTEAGKEFRDLADKFLIGVCDGRVEMHDLLYTMAKELIEAPAGKYMMLSSNCVDFTSALKNKEGRDNVRGIVLDLSKMEEMPLDNKVFVGMSNLRNLKVHNSLCQVECKLNLPDGIEFPKDNIVRYLDWMNFPGRELPSDFEPKNLIELRLPYSKITRVWNCAKVTPKLRWVDLSHSNNLSSLLGLSKAPNLLRLNLEGCTSLTDLPKEMEEMKCLVFLNLRGCTSLWSLSTITIDSLKTLILSGCSTLKTFKVISKNLETLYLNGTGIKGLPPAIGNLHKLTLLNLKDCKNLVTLPDCFGKLKSLQELKLSRCSNLKIFPNVKEIMENLRVLLLDGTSITEMPMTSLPFLQRLCLSKNDEIRNLKFNTSHLKWLELKNCKNLTSLQLPPNLQCLDAHGCTALRTVTSSLDLPMPTENIHSTLIFTNCNELEQASKNAIISYVQKKGRWMSDDHYNRDFVFNSLIGTCFPGCEVPMWFNHQAVGPVLKLKLPQDWNEGIVNRVALCVVVSLTKFKNQTNTLQVKCTCEFNDNANVNLKHVSVIVGGWSEPGNDEPKKIESEHVFIGYTSGFNNNKCREEGHENGYIPTEISLRFEVTNGTNKVEECKVMKCGFSLLYESEETISLEARFDTTPKLQESRNGETRPSIPSEHNVGKPNGSTKFT